MRYSTRLMHIRVITLISNTYTFESVCVLHQFRCMFEHKHLNTYLHAKKNTKMANEHKIIMQWNVCTYCWHGINDLQLMQAWNRIFINSFQSFLFQNFKYPFSWSWFCLLSGARKLLNILCIHKEFNQNKTNCLVCNFLTFLRAKNLQLIQIVFANLFLNQEKNIQRHKSRKCNAVDIHFELSKFAS